MRVLLTSPVLSVHFTEAETLMWDAGGFVFYDRKQNPKVPKAEMVPEPGSQEMTGKARSYKLPANRHRPLGTAPQSLKVV